MDGFRLGKVSARPGTKEDLPFILSVYKSNFGELVEKGRGWDDGIEGRYMEREITEAPLYILQYEGIDAGFLSYAVLDVLYLRHIEVHPDFNGRGIGTIVLRKLMNERDGKPIRVAVTENNYRGMEFYTNLGFREVGSITLPMNGSRGRQMLRKAMMQYD